MRRTILALLVLLLAACGGTPESGVDFRHQQLEGMLPPLSALSSQREGSAAIYYPRNGDSFFLKSDNAVVDGSHINLASTAGQLAWAIYDYPGIQFDLADSTLLMGHTAASAGVMYVAFSNYDRNAWDLVPVETVSGLHSNEVPIPRFSPFVSSGGACYVGVMTWNGLTTDLGEIDIAMGVENAAPQNLAASDGYYPDRVVVQWDLIAHATGYALQYKPSSADDSAWDYLIAPPGANVTEFEHVAGGSPPGDPLYGVSYDYRVQSWFADGDQSEFSTVDEGYRMLSAPLNLQATYNIIIDDIMLDWQAVDGAEQYDIYRRYFLDEEFLQMGFTVDTSFTDSFLPPEDIYEYRVVAVNSEGESPPSLIAQGSSLGFSFSDFQTFCDTRPDIRMMEMSGKIAVGYFNTRFDDLYFAHATTLFPNGVSSWLHFDLQRGHNSGELTLGMLDGKPALAYRLEANDAVEFIWSDEAVPLTSPTWYPTQLDNSGNAVGRPSWIETAGTPAVCFNTDQTGSDPGLYYYFAGASPTNDADWGSYVLEPGYSAGRTAALQLIVDKPAIVGNMDGFTGFFFNLASFAQPGSPDEWQRSVASHYSETSRNIELVIHDGLPFYAASVFVYADPACWMVRSSQSTITYPAGTSDWHDAGLLEAQPDDIGLSLDLTFINDRPALAYYDEGGQQLQLALSKSPAPGDADWVVNTIATGPDVGSSCALMEYRGMPVLLFWDASTQKIRFAQGE